MPAESTANVSDVSQKMAVEANGGNLVIQQMALQMKTIDESVAHISTHIGELNNRLKEIGAFNHFITEISNKPICWR